MIIINIWKITNVIFFKLDILKEKEGALFALKKNPEDSKELIPFKLTNVTDNTHDSKIFTFEIPDDMILGLNIGHHIALR